MDRFCSLCGENDITSDSKYCNRCNYQRCTDCLKHKNTCWNCINQLCPICNKSEITGNSNNEKYCKTCDRICCLECISLTGCQTIFGTCKECFDLTCYVCNQRRLSLTTLYLSDHHEHEPICDNCR